MGAVVTTGETAIGALVVAAAAIAQAVWTTLRTGKAAQQATLEHRLWQRRADTYVDLLAWAIRQRELAKIRPEERTTPERQERVPDPEELILLEARVSAFASKAVDVKVDEISRPWNLLRVAWGDLEILAQPGTDVAAMRQSFDLGIGQPEARMVEYASGVEAWCTELISLVRGEMARGAAVG